MGVKCSLLGHDYEPAGEERERKEEGSEVITVIRELEQCTRCQDTRIVTESTEVTAVVDLEDDAREGAAQSAGESGGEFDRTIEQSIEPADGLGNSFDAEPDPTEEDAEILTDDGDREPGVWPDDDESFPTDDEQPSTAEPTAEENDSILDAVEQSPTETQSSGTESLAGITVPEGSIECSDCSFFVDAESPHREGDMCPECGSWLVAKPE